MAERRQHIIHGLRDGIPIAMGYFAVTFSLGITFLIIILFLFIFYNVVINCEDGEYYEYEVEADTFAKATESLITSFDKALDDNYRQYNH